MDKKKVIAAAAAAVLFGTSGYLFLKPYFQQTPSVISEGRSVEETVPEWGSTYTCGGEVWNLNRDLKTVAFFGIDTTGEPEPDPNIPVGIGGRADTILLSVLDEKNRTQKIFEVSRDTILSVDVYDHDGSFLYSGKMQINMQYAFGSSAERSCYLMKRKISNLLYGIEVDGCCSLTIDGMVKIVDAMGGIPLTFTEDYSDIDPSYTVGSSVTMDGKEVQRFLRSRDTGVTGSNDARMARQKWFLGQMLSLLKQYPYDKILSWYEAAGSDAISDLDAETMKKMAEYPVDPDTVKLPGETRRGELHDEFILDEDALRTLILETFYVKAQ